MLNAGVGGLHRLTEAVARVFSLNFSSKFEIGMSGRPWNWTPVPPWRTKLPVSFKGNEPLRSRPSFGTGLPGSETIATGPSSGTVSSGVDASAEPMIEMSGQFPALKSEMSHAVRNSDGSAPSTPGRKTTVSWMPASSAVCLIEVVSGGLVEGAVNPGAPIFAVNSGENGTAAQLVGV